MQASDFNAFRQVMTGLAELYGKQLSGPLLDIYWNSLRAWSLEDFSAAAALLVQTTGFMPKPSDFAALAKADGAAEAWLQVVQNVKTSGYRSGRTVGGTADRAVAAIGGYSAVGMSDTDKLHFLERRFCEIYRELEDAKPAIAYQESRRIGGETAKAIGGVVDRLRIGTATAGDGGRQE